MENIIETIEKNLDTIESLKKTFLENTIQIKEVTCSYVGAYKNHLTLGKKYRVVDLKFWDRRPNYKSLLSVAIITDNNKLKYFDLKTPSGVKYFNY